MERGVCSPVSRTVPRSDRRVRSVVDWLSFSPPSVAVEKTVVSIFWTGKEERDTCFSSASLGLGVIAIRGVIASASRPVSGPRRCSLLRGCTKGVLVRHGGAHREGETARERILKIQRRHGFRRKRGGLSVSITEIVLFQTFRRNKLKRSVRQGRSCSGSSCKKFFVENQRHKAVDLN